MLFLLWLLWSSFVTGHHSNLLFRAGTDIVPRGQCWCQTPLPLWAVSWEQTDQTSGGLTSHCPSDPQVRREVESHSLILEETLACESFVTCGSSPPFIHFFFLVHSQPGGSEWIVECLLELDGTLQVIFPIIQFTDERSEPSYINSTSLNTQCLRPGQNVGLLTFSLKHSSFITQLPVKMDVMTGSRDYKD